MDYTIREKCIFCNTKLDSEYFKHDLENYVAHYSVDIEYDMKDMVKTPFNVCTCKKCKTPQTKYLGNLNEIYKINHADSTGMIMNSLHQKNLDFILKYKENINNIIEIGSSKGVLADMVISNMDTKYHIVEPSFFGDRENKIIIDDYYENVDDSTIEANTIIISHVFEHFYEPLNILRKISENRNIDNFFLVFPDLEYYINNNVLHVLNSEHTYYVDNQFIIKLLELYGFKLIEESNHLNHSVLFYFKRERGIDNYDNLEVNFENTSFNLDKYFSEIHNTVDSFNKIISENENVYIWPASVHSLYLINFGLDIENLSGLLDNSKNKTGKKAYGTNLLISDFKEKEKDKNNIILINGGIFNSEVNK